MLCSVSERDSGALVRSRGGDDGGGNVEASPLTAAVWVEMQGAVNARPQGMSASKQPGGAELCSPVDKNLEQKRAAGQQWPELRTF